MSTQFHDLTICRARHTGADAAVLTFNIPPDLHDVFAFIPGQYLTLRATIDGRDERRSYSICSGLEESGLSVGIKRVDGGLFSNYALNLKAGDRLDVMPPQGRFVAPVGGTHRYLLLACGSGITPCLSIAKSVLASEPNSEVTLLYGNRTTASIMFREDIDALKDLFLNRLKVMHFLSREQQDVDFLNGRLDGDRIRALVAQGLIKPDRYDGIYLCGPQTMIEETKAVFVSLGVGKDRMFFELFGTAPAPFAKLATNNQPTTDGEGETQVSIILDGTRKVLHMDGGRETVLAAAQAAGLDLPFSCAGGMCCTCRCKVTEGSARMDVNYSLQDWEQAAGYVLACQARPTSNALTLDFDKT